ncbi:uncharacterized protein LOC121388752 isoform X2 [Gigantopelta aegis]|uniref:uncharacterized protein LOC121388752 isoform X2 n=1 Tax=Gigantopelta aegis TaxID=1735272 RepID=UPI001B887C47|nr:uncharacterized protein LOC121388752 isoform X2 [Gigantopelta aegis]
MNIFSRKKKKQAAKPPQNDPGEVPRPPRTTTITPREDNRWRGLTPPPDRRTPGTEVITPELPPPGPLFRPERGPRAIGRHIPPSPKDYNPYPYERIPVAARRSSVQSVRGLVNSPTTPWSREADHGSTLSVPGDHLVKTPDSNIPTEGSLISDPAGTMTIPDNVPTPASFPGKKRNLISAPYSTWTDPGHVRGRRVPRQRPPHTSWSNATVNGSAVAPVWAGHRLVNDPEDMDTNFWIRRHHGQNDDLLRRPMYIAHDLETDKDFVVTPRGTKTYITRDLPLTAGNPNEIHSKWIPAGYYEEPSYPRVKRVHGLTRYDSDHASLPDPHIIGVLPNVPVHHYRPYSLPSYVGREPRRYPPRSFVPHRDLKPEVLPPPSVTSADVGSALPARLVELTPDGPRDLPRLAPTTTDDRSVIPIQGSIRAGRNDSRLEHIRGAYDNETYRRHDYLPKWGYYVETPPSPAQSMKPRQGSVVDRDYRKRPVPLNRGLLSPRSISKSMRAEHGSTITTASEKSCRGNREYDMGPQYGDDDYGDGYRGNLPYDERRAPEHYDSPQRNKAITKKGRYDNRANRGNRPDRPNKRPDKRPNKRVNKARRVQVREPDEDGDGWGERFATFSNDTRFPFSLSGFLKVAQMELILYCLVVLSMLAAGILSAISANVAGTVGAVTFFCFLATVLFAFDTVLMGQTLREKHKQSYPDSDEDEDSDADEPRDQRDNRRGPRNGGREDDPRNNRRGPRNVGREDLDRRMPQHGRQNRGYEERY